MGTLANSEDLNEMLHNEAFHKGPHYLLFNERNSILFGNSNL